MKQFSKKDANRMVGEQVLSISQYICQLVVMVGTFIVVFCFVLSFFDKLRGLIMRR